VAEVATDMPNARVVYFADCEADMVEMMRCARDLGTTVDWLVKAKQNCCLPDEGGAKLWARTPSGTPLGEITIAIGWREIRKGALSADNCGVRSRDQGWSEGTNHIGIAQSLLVTRRLHDVNPYDYLVDVLQRVKQHPAALAEQRTPRVWNSMYVSNPLRYQLHERQPRRLRRSLTVYM
jgi:hypothetical protein